MNYERTGNWGLETGAVGYASLRSSKVLYKLYCFCLLTSVLTQHSALSTQHFSVLTQHSALSTQHFSVLTQHSALSTQHFSVLTHHSALSTQHFSVLTQHSALSTQHSSVLTQHSALSTQHFSVLTHHSALSTQHFSVLTHHSALSTQHFSCPADVETLTILMLRDLPSYANRVTQRARLRDTAYATLRDRSLDVYGYFIVAGQAEFSPLTLGPGEYNPTTSQGGDNIQQVFFTTLQRRYTTAKAVQIQDYHWLFLTKTASGWRLAMMFSMIGPYPAGRPPTAPRDSSYGVIGQAIEIWLRDCYGGVVRSDMGDRTSLLLSQ